MFESDKITESILNRSVLKEIKYKNELIKNKTGNLDAGVVSFDKPLVISDSIAIGAEDVKAGIYRAFNNVCVSGGKPLGFTLTILLPKQKDEEIKKIMRDASFVAKELDAPIISGQTEVSDCVIKTVVTVTAIGEDTGLINRDKTPKETVLDKIAETGEYPKIVMSGFAGIEGTALITREYHQKLEEKFPSHFVQGCEKFENWLFIGDHVKAVLEDKEVRKYVQLIHDASKGGVFTALWDIAKSTGKGITVELKKIPVMQETIELANMFDVNPYKMASAGAVLFVTDCDKEIISALEKAGIPAKTIGYMQDSNDKLVVNEDDRRCLEPFKHDDLTKISKYNN